MTMLLALLSLSVIPVGFRVGRVELAVVDVVLPLVLVVIATRWASLVALRPSLRPDTWRVAVICAAGVVSWASVALVVNRVDPAETFLTMGFFLRGLVFVAAAQVICGSDLARARLVVSRAIVVGGAMVAIPLVISRSPIRREFASSISDGRVTQIRGDFLGFPLYGQGQVNSFSYWFALVCGVSMFVVVNQSERTPWRLLAAATGIASAYVTLQAGSRTGLLFLLLLGALVARRLSRSRVQAVLVPVMATIAIGALLAPSALGLPLILGERLQRLGTSDLANLEELSNGRLFRVRVMLSDVLRSPIVGTGFFDFDLFHEGHPVLSGSPHNQWVGAIHKMGLLGGGLYCAYFIRLLMRSRRGMLRDIAWAALVTCLVLDGVTVPVTAALVGLVLGISQPQSTSTTSGRDVDARTVPDAAFETLDG